jgi:hypothetical protein
VPAIKLTGAKSGTRTAPKRKPAAKQAPTRKPAASKRAAKPAAAPASTNGGGTRGPKLPEGWSQRDFNQVVKEMGKARAARDAAAEKLAEAQEHANGMALELLQEGVQMSVISTELDLSRQWLYTLMEKNGITPAGAKAKKPAARRTAATGKTSKPAAKKRPAAKKPAAKTAPARKRPASAPATTPRGRVRIR